MTVNFLNPQAEPTPGGKSWLDMLQEFNQTNEQQITVRLEDARAATNTEKLKVLSAAGTPPDFAAIAYFSGAELYAPSITVDVDALLKKDRRWARLRADIFPDMLDRVMWGSKLTSVPANVNVQAVLYSPSLLARAGAAVPKAGRRCPKQGGRGTICARRHRS